MCKCVRSSNPPLVHRGAGARSPPAPCVDDIHAHIQMYIHTWRPYRAHEIPARACVNGCVAAPPPGAQGRRSQKPTGTMRRLHTRPHTDVHTHLPSPGRPRGARNASTCMYKCVCSSTCMCKCVCNSNSPWCSGEQEPETHRHHALTTYTHTYRCTYAPAVPTGRTKCQHVHVWMRVAAPSLGAQVRRSQKPTSTMRRRHTSGANKHTLGRPKVN